MTFSACGVGERTLVNFTGTKNMKKEDRYMLISLTLFAYYLFIIFVLTVFQSLQIETVKCLAF